MAGYERHELERKGWPTAAEIRDRFPEAMHREFLRRAIASARRAGIEERTGFPFGALIVDRGGRVASDAPNRVAADFDPTAHAEVRAIRLACASLKAIRLEGCLLYASSEPCPMCLSAAYWASVDGVVFAAGADDSAAINGFDDAFLYRQVAEPAASRRLPTFNLMRDEALAVLKEYDARG